MRDGLEDVVAEVVHWGEDVIRYRDQATGMEGEVNTGQGDTMVLSIDPPRAGAR